MLFHFSFTLVFYFLLLLFNGCTSIQKKPTLTTEQNFTWNSRATIQDLIQKKTHNVNIQVFMKNEEKLRLEITGLMSYNIASILMDQNSTTYCIYPRKQCFSGLSSEQT
nr:hypothetical protein [Pseudobdellovibrionaceae bacterium]